MLDTVLIVAELSEPPSEILYFRYFTAFAKVDLAFDVVIESQKDFRDLYYKYLKKHGARDFVYDFVIPEDNVDAIRVDVTHDFPRTILTDRITCCNVPDLINTLKVIKATDGY